MADQRFMPNSKAIQDRGLNRDRLFPDADAEWREIGVAAMALVERAGSIDRFFEIIGAMGIRQDNGGRA